VTWVMWNLASFCLEIVLVVVQDRHIACAKRTISICSEIVWTHTLVPLGEEAQVEVIQDGCTVCVEHTIGLEIALDAPDGTLSRCASCGISVLSLETVLLSVQDSARFVPNVPLAQKSFWTHPMVLLGDEAQVKARSVWRQC
jgi:hypothetical protein